MRRGMWWFVLAGCCPMLACKGQAAPGAEVQLARTHEMVRPAAKLAMSNGASINLDTKRAIQEAHTRMMKSSGQAGPPRYLILYSSIGYDQKALLAEANRLMPGTKIYGYTSIVGSATNTGLHVGEGKTEGNGLSIMGFWSQDAYGVGATDFDEAKSAREAGKLAIQKAIRDAGKTEKDSPRLIFISTAPFGRGVEEEVIAGVEEVTGEGKVPIIGGIASGDEAYTGGWFMFANQRVLEKGVVVAPVYTDVKVGYIYLAGFQPTEHKGTVTGFKKGTERVLQSIDRRPAGVVLNEWLGGMLSNHLGTKDNIIPLMGVHPIGIKTVETGGFVNWALVYSWWYHPDNSLTVGVSTPAGEDVYLLEGDPEMLIKRPALTSRLARSRGAITVDEIAGVVMDHCGGTFRSIPRGRRHEMIPLINEAVGEAPLIGAFNSGNYGYFAGVGNRYGNMMVNMVVLAKN